ncbi:MAG TPA: hypothetical protein VIP77_16305 [Jiangellaceae bacterium]
MSADLNAIKARLQSREAFRVRGVTTWTSEADADIAALIQALEEAVTRIDEIEKWATDHFGDSTEFPTDLAFAFWGMPSAADLETSEDECIDDTDLCEHGLRFGCKDCEESP